MKSSLEHKTVRPGRLADYSYYYSNRRPPRTDAAPAVQTPGGGRRKLLLMIPILIVAVFLFSVFHADQNGSSKTSVQKSKSEAAVTTAPQKNECADNTLDHFIKVSISARHLWACEGNRQVKDFPVITGMQQIAENATPAGTYRIYAKATDTRLTGTASTGAWDEPVNYWMPFLDNQYGTYGFHDAPWRKASEFGHTDPNSTNGSHGCVQATTENMGWLYHWASVGTTLTITD